MPTILPLSCPRCEDAARAYCFTHRGGVRLHSECNGCGLRFARIRCTWAQFALRVAWAMTLPFLAACGVIVAYVWLVVCAGGL